MNSLRPVSTKQVVYIKTKKFSVLRRAPFLLVSRCRIVTGSFLAEKVKTSGRRYEVEKSSICIVGRIAWCASGPFDERQSKEDFISSRLQVVS